MQEELEKVWAAKLGIASFHPDLFNALVLLMMQSRVDYTIFFRELSNLPENALDLKKSFYLTTTKELDDKWQVRLSQWRGKVLDENSKGLADVSAKMKQTNPKYSWREWLVVPAYQQAAKGDYSLLRELQEVLCHPYDEQTKAVEAKYYQLKPKKFFDAGGISHYSCSS